MNPFDAFRSFLKDQKIHPSIAPTTQQYLAAYNDWAYALPDSEERHQAWQRYVIIRDAYEMQCAPKFCYHPIAVERYRVVLH